MEKQEIKCVHARRDDEVEQSIASQNKKRKGAVQKQGDMVSV